MIGITLVVAGLRHLGRAGRAWAASFLWISLPVIWILASRAVFSMMMLRRRGRLYAQFPDCLGMIVRSVRAGVPLTEAIRIVARKKASFPILATNSAWLPAISRLAYPSPTR